MRTFLTFIVALIAGVLVNRLSFGGGDVTHAFFGTLLGVGAGLGLLGNLFGGGNKQSQNQQGGFDQESESEFSNFMRQLQRMEQESRGREYGMGQQSQQQTQASTQGINLRDLSPSEQAMLGSISQVMPGLIQQAGQTGDAGQMAGQLERKLNTGTADAFSRQFAQGAGTLEAMAARGGTGPSSLLGSNIRQLAGETGRQQAQVQGQNAAVARQLAEQSVANQQQGNLGALAGLAGLYQGIMGAQTAQSGRTTTGTGSMMGNTMFDQNTLASLFGSTENAMRQGGSSSQSSSGNQWGNMTGRSGPGNFMGYLGDFGGGLMGLGLLGQMGLLGGGNKRTAFD